MDTDKVKIFGSRIRATSTEQLGDLERAERNKMKEKLTLLKRTVLIVSLIVS